MERGRTTPVSWGEASGVQGLREASVTQRAASAGQGSGRLNTRGLRDGAA